MSVGPAQLVKVLLDEDLSPWVAERLRAEDGIDAVHVRDRGGLGIRDDQVLALAFAEDRVLLTANVSDFHRLARACEIHAGLVFIRNGALLRREQLAIVRKILEVLGQEHDLVNRVLHVEVDGTMTLEDIPPTV